MSGVCGEARYSAPHGVHDNCVMALALAVQHHAGMSSRGEWVEAMTPPSEARMAQLVAEEMRLRDRALREALERGGMTMADLQEEKWEPLDGLTRRSTGW